MNFPGDYEDGSEALMAWLQNAFRAQDRIRERNAIVAYDVTERARMKYGLAVSDRTVDIDYMVDDWNISLIRITAVEREEKITLEIKRFAGPREEAYDEANEWRDSLGGKSGG